MKRVLEGKEAIDKHFGLYYLIIFEEQKYQPTTNNNMNQRQGSEVIEKHFHSQLKSKFLCFQCLFIALWKKEMQAIETLREVLNPVSRFSDACLGRKR